MRDLCTFLPVAMLSQQSVMEIRKCNEVTARYGMQLSEPEILQLVESRKEALEQSGRIEFGGGVIQKLIMEFVDSPYLYQENYASTIMELQECFYYFKRESLELPDDELLHLMKRYFDDICQGSIEYLQTTILENYCRDLRYDRKEYQEMNGYEDDYTEFLDWDEKEY